MARTRREKTQKQNRTLNWLLSKAGLDASDEGTRDYFERVTGKRRRTDMDFYDYRKMINKVASDYGIAINGCKATATEEASGPREPRTAQRRDPGEQITNEQRELLFRMYQQAGISGTKAQAGVCLKATGKMFPETVGDAAKVIEAVKAIEARGGLKGIADAPEREETAGESAQVLDLGKRRRRYESAAEGAVRELLERGLNKKENDNNDNDKGA